MSDRDKRIVIGLLAVFIGVLALVATLLLLIAPLGCLGESDGGLDRNSVLCDAERGQWWRVAQVGLVVIAWAGLVVGATRALRKAQWPPLVAVAVVAVVAFPAAFAINGVHPGDKPIPRLSGVALMDRVCAFPCDRGVRVAFTVDRDAEVVFTLAPTRREVRARYERLNPGPMTDLVGSEGAPLNSSESFDAGLHQVRIRGLVIDLGRPGRTSRPFPPGNYTLHVIALPRRSIEREQAKAQLVRVGPEVTILPAGG